MYYGRFCRTDVIHSDCLVHQWSMIVSNIQEVQLQNLVTSSGHYHGLSDTLHRAFSVFSR